MIVCVVKLKLLVLGNVDVEKKFTMGLFPGR
jgi:hypothetical protein